MKKDIHPEYMEATVRCSCGNTFITRATKPELRVELCNACHPFYTGQQKFVDTGGRVQRFADKYGSAASAISEREAAKKAEKAAAKEVAEAEAQAVREVKAAKKAEKAARYADRASRTKEKEVKAPAEDASVEELIIDETPAVETAAEEAVVEEAPASETAAE